MINKLSIPTTLAVATTLLLLTLFLGSLTADAAGAVDCTVPSVAYPTLTSAVDDASCDVIKVAEGEFYERIIITRPLTIQGSGTAKTTINGGALGRVFTINSTVVLLKDLAITNGSADAGGGIHNENTTLTISGCHIHKNWAENKGGGVYSTLGDLDIVQSVIDHNEAYVGGGVQINSGTSNISHSELVNNEVAAHGGGLSTGGDSTVTIEEVLVNDNITHNDGGGIYNYGTMTIMKSSISRNKSTDHAGGGIRNYGNLTINNSTISGHGDNSGISNNGSLFINNSTISGNGSGHRDGSGIYNQQGALRLNNTTISNNTGLSVLYNLDGNIRVQNTVIAANLGKDCGGTIHSDGYNLVGNDSNCDFRASNTDLLNVPVNLGPLSGNPGYHPLLLGNGINAGNPDGCKNHLGELLDSDQRGMLRVGRCDIGAYEYQGIYQQLFLPLGLRDFCGDFFDDFADPSSGWEVGEDDYERYGYLNGEYQVYTKVSGYFYVYPSPACERNDIIVDVDARWEGAPGFGYGILFNIKGDFDQYYLFGINSDSNRYWLQGKGPGGWYTIIELTNSGAIRSGSQSNHLKVTRNGNQIRLEINGVHLQTIDDSGISGPGFSGIFSRPYDDLPVSDARFDNFSVNYLPSATTFAADASHLSGHNSRPAGSLRIPHPMLSSP